MTVREFAKQRSRLQNHTWFGLPLVIIGGWFYPKFEYLLLGCMIGALGIAAFRGRTWCNWMCPRGSFYDLFLGKVSSKKTSRSFLGINQSE
jgi:ferredoxin-type protein NapH